MGMARKRRKLGQWRRRYLAAWWRTVEGPAVCQHNNYLLLPIRLEFTVVISYTETCANDSLSPVVFI